jgi:hypothetical protein
MTRQRLRDRRQSETFNLSVGGLSYIATASWYSDGRVGELFLANSKSNSAADIVARDSGIAFSIAVQCGADPHAIRRALCRDGLGRACGPLGAALDALLGDAP